MVDSPLAAARLTSYQENFRAVSRSDTLLPPGAVEHFDLVGGRLRAKLPTGSTPKRSAATVALPASANGKFQMSEGVGGMSIEVGLHGALAAPAQVAKGYVVYPGGHASGADVLHRVTEHGTEDYLAFASAPASPEVSYQLDIGPKVAGLRLVANTLEMLDAAGAPRIRINPPFLVGADGKRVSARLDVEGCAFDTSFAPTRGRPLIDPGAASCEVRISWKPDGVHFPAVLDPQWTSTNAMVYSRTRSTATTLNNGTVLLVGGEDGAGNTFGVGNEIFTPDGAGNGTFSAAPLTDSLDGGIFGRAGHSATKMNDGRVLVDGGGIEGGGNLDFVYGYDYIVAADGIGLTVINPASSEPKTKAAAILMHGGADEGRVLICDGDNGNAIPAFGSPTCTCNAFDPSSNTFIAKQNTLLIEEGGTLVQITGGPRDGQYARIGGRGAGSSATGSPVIAFLDNSATNQVGLEQSLPIATDNARAVALPGGKILVVDNSSNPLFTGVSGQLVDTNIADGAPGHLTDVPTAHTHRLHTLTVLQNGQVLAAGTQPTGVPDDNFVEIFDPATNAWTDLSASAPLINGRFNHTASLLANGQVLVAGGNGALNQGELFSLACAPGFSNCANVCTSNTTNTNCGGCGIACTPPAGPTSVCFTAQCVPDVNGNGTCDQPNVSSCGQPYCELAGLGITPAPDPNFATCAGAGAWKDTDGDGLSDAAEAVRFIDLNCNGVQDPTDVPLDVDGPPSATTPDFYLHYDYVDAGAHNHNPPVSAIALLRNAFKAHGITLHIDPTHHAIPEAIAKVVSVIPSPGNVPDPACAGASAQSPFQLRATYADVALEKPVFHYLVFGHWSSCDSVGHCLACAVDPECGGGQPPQFGALGSAEIGGNDAIVSLGPFTDSSVPIPDETWAGLALHELGHNLGLFHGGPVCDNFKPNYLSAMNYNFYTTGIPVGGAPGDAAAKGCATDGQCQASCNSPADCRNGADCVANLCNDAHCSSSTHLCYRIDLSNFQFNNLNEFASSPSVGGLDETIGLTGNPNSRDVTEWSLDGFTPLNAATNGTHIDWNQDTAFGTHVNQDLNFDGANTTLSASNDWLKLGGVFTNLNFNFQCSSHFADAGTEVAASQEPTFDDLKARHHLYLPQQVTIDIRPGCGSNWIVLGSPLTVPVILYGSAQVDVSQIDQSTLRLAGGPASGAVTGDTNGDGFADLTISFPMSGLQLGAGATSARLTGAKFSSQAVFGTDLVTIVPFPGPVIVLHNDGTGYSRTISHQLDHSFTSYTLGDCVDSATDRCGGVLNVNTAGQILRITSDEADGCAGSGTAGADMTINSNSSFSLRRERSGVGDGRVYTVTFTETDSSGNSTQAQCKIQVPHDANGPNATDSGPQLCVGTGC